MHTYRKVDGSAFAVWEVGYQHPNATFVQLGPKFGVECEAAAFASFLNGGRYCPDEIAPIFLVPVDEKDDDSTPPDRPAALDDYPLERKRK